jgi:hypothetical protein
MTGRYTDNAARQLVHWAIQTDPDYVHFDVAAGLADVLNRAAPLAVGDAENEHTVVGRQPHRPTGEAGIPDVVQAGCAVRLDQSRPPTRLQPSQRSGPPSPGAGAPPTRRTLGSRSRIGLAVVVAVALAGISASLIRAANYPPQANPPLTSSAVAVNSQDVELQLVGYSEDNHRWTVKVNVLQRTRAGNSYWLLARAASSHIGKQWTQFGGGEGASVASSDPKGAFDVLARYDYAGSYDMSYVNDGSPPDLYLALNTDDASADILQASHDQRHATELPPGALVVHGSAWVSDYREAGSERPGGRRFNRILIGLGGLLLVLGIGVIVLLIRKDEEDHHMQEEGLPERASGAERVREVNRSSCRR